MPYLSYTRHFIPSQCARSITTFSEFKYDFFLTNDIYLVVRENDVINMLGDARYSHLTFWLTTKRCDQTNLTEKRKSFLLWRNVSTKCLFLRSKQNQITFEKKNYVRGATIQIQIQRAALYQGKQ